MFSYLHKFLRAGFVTVLLLSVIGTYQLTITTGIYEMTIAFIVVKVTDFAEKVLLSWNG